MRPSGDREHWAFWMAGDMFSLACPTWDSWQPLKWKLKRVNSESANIAGQ